MTNEENVVIEEPLETTKVSAIKKFLTNPKQLAIATGLALATIGGVVWFAIKRQDEEDFDAEFPELANSEKTSIL